MARLLQEAVDRLELSCPSDDVGGSARLAHRPTLRPAWAGTLLAVTDTLRVIIEIGKKRRVVAGAMDWPGLDRWGPSEDGAIAKMLSYVPRYAGVADRAGIGTEFARARDVTVVERVPGSSSTDFWGVAHVPSQIEGDVLSSADLERRLELLRACWAYFDDVAARVSEELALDPAAAGAVETRSSAIPRRKALPLVPQGRRPHRYGRYPHPRGPRGPSARVPRSHPRLQRRKQAGEHLADPIPHTSNRPTRHGSRVGDGRPGSDRRLRA